MGSGLHSRWGVGPPLLASTSHYHWKCLSDFSIIYIKGKKLLTLVVHVWLYFRHLKIPHRCDNLPVSDSPLPCQPQARDQPGVGAQVICFIPQVKERQGARVHYKGIGRGRAVTPCPGPGSIHLLSLLLSAVLGGWLSALGTLA